MKELPYIDKYLAQKIATLHTIYIKFINYVLFAMCKNS